MGIAPLFSVRIRELLISIAAITILIALLMAADGRVRERFEGATTASVSHHVAESTGVVQSVTRTARQLIIDSGPLTLLVIASGVLVAFMLRT